MAAPEAPKDTTELFKELNEQIKQENHKKCQEISQKILEVDPKDQTAKKCLIVSLIAQDNFLEAINLIEKENKENKDHLFNKEYALALHKNKELDRALKLILEEEKNARKEDVLFYQYLKAQIYYKKKDMEKCFDIYESIFTTHAEEIDDVVLTNFAACGFALSNEAKKLKCLKMIETAAKKNETLQEEDVIFEFFSNWALLALSVPKKDEKKEGLTTASVDQIEKNILTAFEKCEKLLEEETQNPQIAELNQKSPITFLMAYLRQTKQNRPKEAKNLYESILSLLNSVQSSPQYTKEGVLNEKKKLGIQYLHICVLNNILALTKNNNNNSTKAEKYMNKVNKIMIEFPGLLENQFTTEQKGAILFNRSLQMISSRKEKFLNTKKFIDEEFAPLYPNEAKILQAALEFPKQPQVAAKILSETIEERINSCTEEEIVPLQIALATINLSRNHVKESVSTLENLGNPSKVANSSYRFEPAIVAWIISLYLRLKEQDAAVEYFKKSVQHWETKKPSASEEKEEIEKKKILLMEEQGNLLLSLQQQNEQYLKDAIQIFEKLMTLNPSKKDTYSSILLLIDSTGNATKVETLTKELLKNIPDFEIADFKFPEINL